MIVFEDKRALISSSVAGTEARAWRRRALQFLSAAPPTQIPDLFWSVVNDNRCPTNCPTPRSLFLYDLSLYHAILDLAAPNNRHLHELAAIKLEKEADFVLCVFRCAF